MIIYLKLISIFGTFNNTFLYLIIMNDRFHSLFNDVFAQMLKFM